VGAFSRRHGRKGSTHLRSTIWTLAVSLATAVTLLLLVTIVILVATAPNWLGR
jgi:hypothetical protein